MSQIRYLLIFLFSISTTSLAFVLVAESISSNSGSRSSGYQPGTEYVYKYRAEIGLFEKKISNFVSGDISNSISMGPGIFSNLGAVLNVQAVWTGKPEEKLMQIQVFIFKINILKFHL